MYAENSIIGVCAGKIQSSEFVPGKRNHRSLYRENEIIGVCSGKMKLSEFVPGKRNYRSLFREFFPATTIKDRHPSSHALLAMQPAMSTDTPICVDGRPPLIHMQDHSITLYNPSSKLFASLNTTDNKTTIMAYTRRVGGKFDELQEVFVITANVERDIKMPWVCPWPYTITDWSRKHVRVDSMENASFWCVVKSDLLPIPLAYIELE